MTAEEAERIGIASMTADQKHALAQWAMRVYGLGKHTVADIEDVKYDGRLVLLNDGSRWEVDAIDAAIAMSWGLLDKVVIIDDEMYRLTDLEMVHVQEDVT